MLQRARALRASKLPQNQMLLLTYSFAHTDSCSMGDRPLITTVCDWFSYCREWYRSFSRTNSVYHVQ